MPDSPRMARTAPADTELRSTQPAEHEVSWFGEIEGALVTPNDSAPVVAGIYSPAFSRLLQAFLAARVLLGIVLLVGLVASVLMNRSANVGTAILVSAYAALSLAWWWWPQAPDAPTPTTTSLGGRRRGTWSVAMSKGQQTMSAVILDLTCFALLNHLEPGVNLNTAALMALPVLMASVLLRRFLAVATAAAATLLLLGGTVLEAWLNDGWGASFTAAGISGLGFFAIALSVSELALRLSREQRTAQGHMDVAKQQAQLNRLVLDEMPQGVMVIDRQGHVRSANPAARKLLSPYGQTESAPFQLRGVPAWQPLVKSIEQAFASPGRRSTTQHLMITFDDQLRRGLQMRLKFIQHAQQQPSSQDEVCVVFLEDHKDISARVRQAKLAAMGRMSAALAHEIRNPLAAIVQANALLSEETTNPQQARLTQMVGDNAKRLEHIVTDILTVSPSSREPAPALDIRHAIRDTINGWLAVHTDVSSRQGLKLDLQGLPPAELGQSAMVRFDPEHLRRVLVNLLDNAARHSSPAPQAIIVSAQCLGQAPHPVQVMLSVWSDGPAIEASVEASLFEPFFSTRSQGTGLGLYICRELCEQHGASLEYRAHPPTQRHRNEFYLMMPMVESSPHTAT